MIQKLYDIDHTQLKFLTFITSGAQWFKIYIVCKTGDNTNTIYITFNIYWVVLPNFQRNELLIPFQVLVTCSCIYGYVAFPYPGDNASVDELIQYYFSMQYTSDEICGFLMFVNGILLSVSSLKRIKKRLNLRKNNAESPLENVVRKIRTLHQKGFQNLGYKALWKLLNVSCGLRVTQETVRICLMNLDPEGVYLRSQRRLRRRVYYNKGPNYLIHVDGYDKLKPFGFPIHGFSRKNLWLKVSPSNNNPKYVARFFLNYVKEIVRVPRIVRTDAGTENVLLRDLQISLRMDHMDDMCGRRSFHMGRSTGNQRIERLWGSLCPNFTEFWRSYFKDMRDSGLFNDTDPLHIECIRFCFFPIIQKHLNIFVENWNVHRIRSQRNQTMTSTGVPDIMYYQSEVYDARDYSLQLPCDLHVIDQLAEEYTEEHPSRGCSEEFLQILDWATDQTRNRLPVPQSADEAKQLFCAIIGLCDTLQYQ